jgi:hypothetical protein
MGVVAGGSFYFERDDEAWLSSCEQAANVSKNPAATIPINSVIPDSASPSNVV